MQLWTVTTAEDGILLEGSPRYPTWSSDEPDIFAAEREYTAEEYARIRQQADEWVLETRIDEDDDHGYSQTNSKSENVYAPIEDRAILVKDGAFFGIVDQMKENGYVYKKIYVSILTVDRNHGLWHYHYGYSSDNGSHSEDVIYYLRRAKGE